jgi:hypothetical protein
MRDERPQAEGVDVMYGIQRMRFEGLAGRTLAQARAVLDAALDIQSDATALADGRPVGEDHVISADETIEFMAEAGKKGR